MGNKDLKYMDWDEYDFFIKEYREFFEDSVPDLRDGELSVPEFLDSMSSLESPLRDNAVILTENFDEFAAFFRSRFSDVAEESLAHEQSHAAVCERFGLRVKWGMVVVGSDEVSPFEEEEEDFDDGPLMLSTVGGVTLYVQAFLDDGLSGAARDWPPERILQYIHDVSTAVVDPSPMDGIMSDA